MQVMPASSGLKRSLRLLSRDPIGTNICDVHVTQCVEVIGCTLLWIIQLDITQCYERLLLAIPIFHMETSIFRTPMLENFQIRRQTLFPLIWFLFNIFCLSFDPCMISSWNIFKLVMSGWLYNLGAIWGKWRILPLIIWSDFGLTQLWRKHDPTLGVKCTILSIIIFEKWPNFHHFSRYRHSKVHEYKKIWKRYGFTQGVLNYSDMTFVTFSRCKKFKRSVHPHYDFHLRKCT